MVGPREKGFRVWGKGGWGKRSEEDVSQIDQGDAEDFANMMLPSNNPSSGLKVEFEIQS